MTVFSLCLVLAASVCHATWNFFLKRINAGPELVWLFSFVTVVVYAPVAGFMFLSHTGSFTLTQLVFIAGSAVLHLGYFLLLQAGYRKGDLSLIYPTARATGPILATILAVLVLGETLTPQIALGAGVIIVGVLFLSGGSKKNQANYKPAVSLMFGISAGFLIGSYTVWDAHAVALLLVPPILLDYASSIGRAILMAPLAYKRKRSVIQLWQNHRVEVITIALFNPLAYILVLYAFTISPVVYIAPIRELSVFLTVLMGSILLGEGDLKRRLKWAAVILVGVTILATA